MIECDNFIGYNKLKSENSKIKLQKCWAHVRRRYADILKNLNDKQKQNSKAFLILKEISKLFELEKQYKKRKLTPSQIVEERKKNVPSIKERIYDLVYNSNPAKNSALEGDTKDCWEDLFTFVDRRVTSIFKKNQRIKVRVESPRGGRWRIIIHIKKSNSIFQ